MTCSWALGEQFVPTSPDSFAHRATVGFIRGIRGSQSSAFIAITRLPTGAMTIGLALAAIPLGLVGRGSLIESGRPVHLPDIATFCVDANWGPELTSGQRLLLERQQLNMMKERFRPAGRYEAPLHDRRLRSRCFVARESDGVIIGTAGVELAVVDLSRSIALRRTRGEAMLREALGIQLPEPVSSPSYGGRKFVRKLTYEEEAAELALLQVQESQFDEADPQLGQELACASAALPAHLAVWPLLSCVAIAPSRRREGLGTALCQAAEEQAACWGFGRMLAQCDEDNESGAGMLAALSYSLEFVDREATTTWVERPHPSGLYDRKELEVRRVPMPLIAFSKQL